MKPKGPAIGTEWTDEEGRRWRVVGRHFGAYDIMTTNGSRWGRIQGDQLREKLAALKAVDA